MIEIRKANYAWLRVLRGSVTPSGEVLGTRDGAAISYEKELNIAANSDAEFMLFDLT